MAAVAKADTLVILVPGALASTHLFGPAFRWGGGGTAIVEYRFPGFDDLPADRSVHIIQSASTIADFANHFPGARIRLMGFSTGGAIAIEAAARMRHEDVEVAAISSAVPFPGMLGVGPRGFAQILRAAVATGSVDAKTVWLEYFKTLLFGVDWDKDPRTRAWANAFVERFRQDIVLPDDGVGRSHTSNLLIWTLSEEARSANRKVRFYHGRNDTIVPLRLVQRLAASLNAQVVTYEPDAHLLLITRPSVIVQAGRDLGIAGAGQ